MGNYTFVVKTHRDEIKETRLKIRILPPWYETWWAYLIYIISVGSLLLYLIHAYDQCERSTELMGNIGKEAQFGLIECFQIFNMLFFVFERFA